MVPSLAPLRMTPGGSGAMDVTAAPLCTRFTFVSGSTEQKSPANWGRKMQRSIKETAFDPQPQRERERERERERKKERKRERERDFAHFKGMVVTISCQFENHLVFFKKILISA